MNARAVAAAWLLACPAATARADPAPKDESNLGLLSGSIAITGYTMLVFGGITSGLSGGSHWSSGIVYASLPVFAIGPSLGHFATGDDAIGIAGIATNALGIAVGWAAIDHENAIRERLRATCPPTCAHSDTAFDLELGLAALVVVGSGVFETFDTIRVVRRYNRRLIPTPLPVRGGGGVLWSGTF